MTRGSVAGVILYSFIISFSHSHLHQSRGIGRSQALLRMIIVTGYCCYRIPLPFDLISPEILFQHKKSLVISDSDDDSDVRPSKLFDRPHRTPSGADADEISGLGTKDKKAAVAKHRRTNSSDTDSDDADGNLKTPDCGIDNILALFQVRRHWSLFTYVDTSHIRVQ